MVTLLLVLHVLVSFFLIFIVLVQGGKGAELGAAFGAGSSNTLFGGRGAATFMSKMTTMVAILFMVTSLLLAIASTRETSVIEQTIPAAERSMPSQAPGAPGLPSEGTVPPESEMPLAPAGAGETAPAAPQDQPAGQ